MKVSVIMASYLGYYATGASNRKERFERAVLSFQNQNCPEAELIIVSDGCELTKQSYNELLEASKINKAANIKLISIDKQQEFSGKVRQTGLEVAVGDIICYLDSDDAFFGTHLNDIIAGFEKGYDWVFYNDFVAKNSTLDNYYGRDNIVEFGHIGTSSIAHKRSLPVTWPTGYGHDWQVVTSLLGYGNYAKIKTKGYMVCHIPGHIDH